MAEADKAGAELAAKLTVSESMQPSAPALPGKGYDDSDLARYRKLQQLVAELQGLQIPAQVAQTKRQIAALEKQKAAEAKAVEDARTEVAAAQANLTKHAGGEWFPGKVIKAVVQGKAGEQARIDASRGGLEAANKALEQRKAALGNTEAQLAAVARRLEKWNQKAQELAIRQEEAQDLEDLLFQDPADEDEAEELDALCAVDEEEDGGGEEHAEGAPKGDQFGKFFRGRLIRMTAHKVKQIVAKRRARNEGRKPGMLRLAQSLGAKSLLPSNKYASEFPPAANSFNPAIHCKPSTFLWPYSHKFMGRLHKLQTGPILQAFYRFGPFDADPSEAASAHGSSDSDPSVGGGSAASGGGGEGRTPLILLPGLGATMICWGVPILRALACSHDVIVMEYAGAGLSVDSSGLPWNYYRQAEAVLLLADALGISKPNLLGWSSGGNTGLVLAALHGDRMGKIVSIAGMAGGKNTIVPPMYEMLNPERSLSLGQTMALLFPADEPDFRRVVGDYLKAVSSMPGVVTNSSVGAKAAKEQWEADVEFIHNDETVWDKLPDVKTPLLLLNGEKDCLVPVENAERLHARIPSSRLHKFAKWGHAYKNPVQLVEVVNEFLLG